MVKSSEKNNILSKLRQHQLFKNRVGKFAMYVLIFVLFFDKLTIFLLMYLSYYLGNLINTHKEPFINNLNFLFGRFFKNSKEPFTKLDYTNFDTSYNNSSYNPLYSNIFKNPYLNLKSYNKVAIDPSKPLLENNKFLPECCLYNSEYSTSKGCACITPTQQEYLRRRGTNKSASSFIQTDNMHTNLFFSPTLAIQGDPIPFNKNNTNYILDYQDLTSEKISEFKSLTNKLDNELINYNPSTEVTI